MKGKTMNTFLHYFLHFLLPMILGIVVTVIVFAALDGKALPMVTTPHASLIALLVVGLMMCFLGGVGQVGATGRWTSLPAIIGSLLGIVILVIIISVFAEWKIPLITGRLHAIAAVGILIGVKLLIGTVSFYFHWL